MWWRVLALLPLLGQAASPCFGQLVGEIRPSAAIALTGEATTVGIDIDLGTGGATLGSYGASLSWNPAVLQFVGFTGGDPPFDAPVVNTGNVASGLLSYADAEVTGGEGRVNVLNVTFQTIADPPATSALDLEFTSLFDAGSLDDLQPQLAVEDGSACVADFSFDLRLAGGNATILDWSAIAGAVSYDVIRGNLHDLSDAGAFVSLGVTQCIENGSVDTTTGAGTEPANPDTATPLQSEGFHYLVRFHDGIQNRTYGWFQDCLEERSPDAGDCP